MGHQPFGLLAGLQRSGGSVLKRWVGPRPSGDARGRCPPGSGCLRVGTPPFPADRRSGSSVPCLTLSTIAWVGAVSVTPAPARSWRRRVGIGRIILRRRSIGRACGRRIEGGAESGPAGSFSGGAASAAPAAGASKAAPGRDRPDHSPSAQHRPRLRPAHRRPRRVGTGRSILRRRGSGRCLRPCGVMAAPDRAWPDRPPAAPAARRNAGSARGFADARSGARSRRPDGRSGRAGPGSP